MKLLVCVKCSDIFNLKKEKKSCTCGKSWGVYLADGLNAEYGGPCLPLGFANGSFIAALKNQPEKDWGKEFTAFVIQKECPTMKRIGEAPEIAKPESESERMLRMMKEIEQINKKSSKKAVSKKKKKKSESL